MTAVLAPPRPAPQVKELPGAPELDTRNSNAEPRLAASAIVKPERNDDAMVMFGIALAVAVVPEALPAVVTISLAIGVRRMIRRNALVRRCPSSKQLISSEMAPRPFNTRRP
jgi:E1-E2 ATPase